MQMSVDTVEGPYATPAAPPRHSTVSLGGTILRPASNASPLNRCSDRTSLFLSVTLHLQSIIGVVSNIVNHMRYDSQSTS